MRKNSCTYIHIGTHLHIYRYWPLLFPPAFGRGPHKELTQVSTGSPHTPVRSHFDSTDHPFARNEEIRYRNLSFYVRTGFHSIAAPFAMRNFEAGDIVLVTDLIESVKYNGSIGVVQAPGRPGRVVVKLQGKNTLFPLRFTNF